MPDDSSSPPPTLPIRALPRADADSRLIDLAAQLSALKDRALDGSAEGITIADARLPDRPLIYVNEGFRRLTGYTAEAVIGRNCRFLQGPATDRDTIAEIHAAVAAGRECIVELLNYRRDGTPFWNRLSVTPIRDELTGEVTHFIGIQSDVSARREAEGELRRTKEQLEKDLRLAAITQQALLPPPEQIVGSLRIARAFHPCTDLAGDGVGAVILPDGAIGVFLLDVSGHGVGAALLSFTLNHLLSPTIEASTLVEDSAGGRRAAPPALVADRLNRQFPMDRSRQYFTLVYGILESASNRLRYVTAGHPAPILLRPGEPPRALASTGPPIGLLEQAAFEDASVGFEPGDRVYLYSDGVTEACDANDEEFGLAQLIAQIDRHRHLDLREGLESIVDAVRQWTGEALRDDVSLIAVERIRTIPPGS